MCLVPVSERTRYIPKMHDLKVWPQYFVPINLGVKNFELRINDRDFRVGDYVRLREYDPIDKEYTGAEVFKRIAYITDGFGLRTGYVCMALE